MLKSLMAYMLVVTTASVGFGYDFTRQMTRHMDAPQNLGEYLADVPDRLVSLM